MNAGFEVFVSHATEDREHVSLVSRQIEALGARVYLAENDPKAGASLADKVEEALRRASVVVVLITSTSINSRYVHQEIGAARAFGKIIIPIVDSRLAGEIDLGMLAGIEYLPLDVTRPADALADVTARLQELIQAQLAVQTEASDSLTLSDGEKLVLLLLLVVGGYLLLSEGGGSTPA